MSTVTELKLLTHDIVDTNPNNFSDARMIRGFNKAQDIIVNQIMQKDTLSQWDEMDYGDLAEGYLDLTSTVQSYNVREDENFADLLAIHKIYIKETSTAVEYQEMKKEGKSFSVDTGIPDKYRISGWNLVFNYIPNYSATNGIKVVFTRVPKPISASDTTRKLSIPVTFHHLIALLTAYDYARAKRLDNRNDILAEITKEEQRLGIFVSKQSNGTNITLSPEEINSV